MHLGTEDWDVVEANPIYASEFTASGELTLRLKKAEQGSKNELSNPNDMLFTLPTIANELATSNATAEFNDFTLVLHEDDWRQCEFFTQRPL